MSSAEGGAAAAGPEASRRTLPGLARPWVLNQNLSDVFRPIQREQRCDGRAL